MPRPSRQTSTSEQPPLRSATMVVLQTWFAAAVPLLSITSKRPEEPFVTCHRPAPSLLFLAGRRQYIHEGGSSVSLSTGVPDIVWLHMSACIMRRTVAADVMQQVVCTGVVVVGKWEIPFVSASEVSVRQECRGKYDTLVFGVLDELRIQHCSAVRCC